MVAGLYNVCTRVVFQIVELIHFPQQRLQAQFGGGVPAGLAGHPFGNR